MAQILVTKPDALNQRDKALLRKSGVVVVEADSPADVKLVSTDSGEISAGGMLYACLKAITTDQFNNGTGGRLAKTMLDVLESERAASEQPA